MIKKVISLILILTMTLAVLAPVTAFAEASTEADDPGALYIQPVNEFSQTDDDLIRVDRGEEFDLVFYTVSAQPIALVWGGMKYDSKRFDLIDSEICLSGKEDGALFTGYLSAEQDFDYVEFEITPTAKDPERFADLLQEDGLYVQPLIRLRMKLNAPDGEYPIQYYLMEKAKDINGKLLFDSERGFQSSNFHFGITVLKNESQSLRGDADSDGKITVLDATRIQRYLAGLETEETIDTKAADADLDGSVTVLDATRIQRYLAGLSDMDGNLPPAKPTEPPTEPTEPYTEPPTQPVSDQLQTPIITKAESGNSGVVLKWDAVPGAEGYRVFMKNGSSWKMLGDTTDPLFIHADAAYDTEITYTVRCISADLSRFTSDYDKTGYRNTRLRNPSLKSAKLLDGFIGISWDKVAGATAYRIYIKGGKYRSWSWIYDSDINYIDVDTGLADLESGVRYTFTVRCVDRLLGDRLTSGYDPSGITVTYYDTPYLNGIVNTPDGIELYWTEVAGVAKYRVFEWSDDKWNRLTDTENTALRITGLTRGEFYRFTVRGMDADGNYITPYDCFGREMDWDPTESGDDVYSVKAITQTAESYGKSKGFRIHTEQEGLSDYQYIYLLDGTDFYEGNTSHMEKLIGDRCQTLIDYYLSMLRRSGEKSADYDCSVVVESDNDGHIWFYLVLTRLG